ncbi:unnamed protein product [Brassica napus]|uniref:(rape) hypothetical protein n=1 Tax=Brassica napus TaxID=3708 RepID=A0A816MKH0_BRANA|nr:unnamed protein product [Brassica napus]
MQNATNCYGDTGRMTTKHDSLHRGHGIKCEDMGSKRNRITLRRLASAFLPLPSDMLEELVLGFVSGKGLARERFDLVTYPLYLVSWRGYGVLSGGLESACMSAVFSKLQRILLLRSRVISLSYAGGDGGSSLLQHVGDTRKACKVVVYGSSAAARRPSSLWTSTALSLYGSSGCTVFRFSILDMRQMSMRIGRLEAFYMEFSGEHKPYSCIVRCWRKLYMPVLGFLLRLSGASYSGSDTGSLGILENKDFGFEVVERVAELG